MSLLSSTGRSPLNGGLGISLFLLIAALLSGCAAGPSRAEKAENARLARVGEILRPADASDRSSVPGAASSPAEYLTFALSHHPRVAAAYYEWRAAVRAIPGARALPDPQLTFQADIADTIMSLMPGLMFDLMAPGKRAAMGAEATASARSAYATYVSEAVEASAELRRAWIELVYLDESLAIRRERLVLIESALGAARSDYAIGAGMATLEAQTKYLNLAAQLRSEIAGLEDGKAPARQRFKAALGLGLRDPDPAWPFALPQAEALPPDEVLWPRLASRNPGIGAMRAMVEMAMAKTDLAKRLRTPDFAAGLMVDVKADPLMFRPTVSATLPFWREKIESAIRSAEARRLAADARLDAEQLAMVSELAQMLYMVRDADRMLRFVETDALPNLDRAELSARASYQSGMGGSSPIFDLALMKNDMRLERNDAVRERERALAEIARMLASEPVAGRFAGVEP